MAPAEDESGLGAAPTERCSGYRRLVTVEEILSELRRSGEPQRVASLKRSGAASPAFGVGLPRLRSLAKRIGHDHELALALWEKTVREARILASLIDESERVTEKQMDRWAETTTAGRSATSAARTCSRTPPSR